MIKTPLHKLIRQYRILAIAIILYFAFMLEDMWVWFEVNHQNLTMHSAGVFGSLVLLIGGGLKFALENIMKEHSGDREND